MATPLPPALLAVARDPAARAIVRAERRRRAIAASFVDFLPALTIHDDDPIRPSRVPFVPYPYQVERGQAWQDGASEVNLKARQLGFSWLAAAYKLWRAAFHGWTVAYISKGQVEARAHLESRVRFMWRGLGGVEGERGAPGALQGAPRWTADTVEFPGGGSIRVFPSTPDAGVQFTFQLVVFDEFAFHQFGVSNWAAILPTLSAGGQILVMSTADPDLGPAGAFYDVWTQAEGGQNGLNAVFTPVLARPGRDREWLERERARIGDPQRADAFYPETAAQAFVGRSGLVFPQFDKQRHVIERHPVEWADCVYRVIGYDPGGGDPHAIVPLGAYRHNGEWRIWQPLEMVKPGSIPTEEIASWMLALHRIGKLDMVVCDVPSDASTLVADLRRFGLPAHKANKDRGSRLQEHARWLESGRLVLHQSCVASIGEYAGYRWAERTDPNSKERYKTTTPVDHHADAMDARGYALLALVQACFKTSVVTRVPVKYRRGVRKDEPPADPVEYVKWRNARRGKVAT